MTFTFQHRSGVVTTMTVLGVTAVVMSAFLTLTVLSTSQLTQGQSLEASEQTFFAAESGINVAMNHLKTSQSPGTLTPMTVNGVTTEIFIDIGSTPYERVITSRAVHPSGQERELQIAVMTSTFAVALNHAVHAGAEGITFNNGSIIRGDAHSNGSVLPANNGDQGEVRSVTDDPGTTQNEAIQFPGNLTVSGNNNVVSQLLIAGNVWAHTLKGFNTTSRRLEAASAKYQVIGPAPEHRVYANGTQCQTGVDAGACDANATVATDQSLPIGTAEITAWANDVKTAASGGTTLSGNQNITGNVVWPDATKVEGDITFNNGATLTVNGALWVTGNVIVSNNGDVTLGSNALIDGTLTFAQNTRMDLSSSLGENDGVVILGDPENPSATSGKIVIENNVTIIGSGNDKSSLTLISTNTSTDQNNPAIDASNTATGVIYFAKDGMIRVRPTGDLNAVFANKIYLDTNAKVTFRPSLHFFSIPNPNPTPIGPQPGTWREV